MSRHNIFREENRELTPDELLLMDDLIEDAAELMDLLIRMESFADPRCLALARTKLEESMLWASQAASKSKLA